MDCEDVGLGWRRRNGRTWQVNKEAVGDTELWMRLCCSNNAFSVLKVDQTAVDFRR